MKFVLDTLQLISQYQVHEEGSVVNHPSYVIVDTYAVRDKRCNVQNRFFFILSDGHHIIKAILNISKNCDGALLQFGDIITINQYTTVVTKEQYIIMIGDFYVKHSRVNEPDGFPQWFTINVDLVRDSKSIKPNDKVWFTVRTQKPEYMSTENLEKNTIIDNWVILPNGCIAGTAYSTDTEFKNAPVTHSQTDTHGVSNCKYLPSIATNVVLSFCRLTSLRLDPNADFGTVKEFTNVTTLSGSSYYLANKRDNTVMNQIVKYYTTKGTINKTTLYQQPTIRSNCENTYLPQPHGQIERVFTASFIQSMVHNNQFVCQVQLCSSEDHLAATNGNAVYFYLPLFEYTRSRDLFIYLKKDRCSTVDGPPKVGDYVSILMRGKFEPTNNDEIDNDTYNVIFVSHSRLLHSYYSKSEVCQMRSLFSNLNNAVTQGTMNTTSNTKEDQIVDKQFLSKYDNHKSNAPVIRPVVSTTADPLSDDESISNDEEEDDEFSFPLYSGGYKNIDYDRNDRHISKKCKFSNLY